jgi:glutathione S-transferase
MSDTLTLYGEGRSRWIRPLWMLRELGVPFDVVEVDRPGGELNSPQFRELNPSGKIPVLVDRGQPISESGAILLYLGDRFPEPGLLPTAGSIERGQHDQWMFTVATEFEQPLWVLHKAMNGRGGDAAASLREFGAAARTFRDRLAERPFLMGQDFQAVDIMFGHMLTWSVMRPLLPEWPVLRAYAQRLVQRPGFPDHLYADGSLEGL